MQGTDNVQINATYSAKRGLLEEGLKKALDEQFTSSTGLKAPDAKYSKELTYSVTLTGLRGGKPAKDLKYQGKGSTLDEAIANALGGEVKDHDPIMEASLERIAEVPYFTVPITSRSIKKARLAEYHKDSVGQLVAAYAKRVKEQPASANYRVVFSKTLYDRDEHIPKGELRGAHEGRSNVSIDDAAKKAGQPRPKIKTVVYEQVVNVMVYGQEEQSLGRAPAVHTEPKTARSGKVAYGRGASPAGLAPVSLTSTNYLM